MDTTIILQGLIHDKVDLIKTIDHYRQFGKIIISSYFKNNDQIDKIKKLFPHITIINNNLSDFENDLKKLKKFSNRTYHNNCYYQLRTIKATETYNNSTYTIKTRVDTFFHDINKFIEMMKSNKNKITSLSLYVRKFKHIKYHISDILFGGYTNKIKKTVDLALANYCSGTPEVVIWKPYIMSYINKDINHDITDENEYIKVMCDLFVIFPINHMSNYNFKGITFFKDEPKSTKNYFIYGVDC